MKKNFLNKIKLPLRRNFTNFRRIPVVSRVSSSLRAGLHAAEEISFKYIITVQYIASISP